MIFIIGFFFISIIGTILHFTYDLSNHNKIVALFSAVNESTWEHIKMALTPYFVWLIVDGIIYESNPSYFFAKLVGILTIIVVIPLIFYGYQLFIKKTILIIDIMSFFIAIALSQYFTYLIITTVRVVPFINFISLILLIVIFGIYLLVTLLPLKNIFFKDPITNKYGIKGHK